MAKRRRKIANKSIELIPISGRTMSSWERANTVMTIIIAMIPIILTTIVATIESTEKNGN